jgi:FkbM family methyltransferase
MNLRSIPLKPYTFWADYNTSPGREILENGLNYEKHVVDELRKWVPDSVGFLDAGANCGIHTLVSKSIKQTLPVVAVECSSFNLSLLTLNITRNHLSDVTVLPFALSDKPALIAANDCPENTCCTVQAPTPDITVGFPRYVPALALDYLNLPPIDLVKIDIEGMELAALRGATRLMSTRPRIIFEFCPGAVYRSNVTPLEALDWFFQQGYLLTTLDYQPGMRAQFTDAESCLMHIEATSKVICDILAEPLATP